MKRADDMDAHDDSEAENRDPDKGCQQEGRPHLPNSDDIPVTVHPSTL
ncbi:hypothetical protein PA07A_1824 [Cutibacterium acnes P07A]|nr:hypothetical protein [Cutibacterium acnes P07A]